MSSGKLSLSVPGSYARDIGVWTFDPDVRSLVDDVAPVTMNSTDRMPCMFASNQGSVLAWVKDRGGNDVWRVPTVPG